MNWADYTILGIFLLSMVVGLFRGFIREVFSVLVWVLAGWAALRASGPLSVRLETWVDVPSMRIILAFVGVFLLVLAVGALVNYLLGKLVSSTGLSGSDRLFGALFGAVRGLAIVVAAVILAGFTPFPKDPWWQESLLLPPMERLAEHVSVWFPESVREHLPGALEDQARPEPEPALDTGRAEEPWSG